MPESKNSTRDGPIAQFSSEGILAVSGSHKIKCSRRFRSVHLSSEQPFGDMTKWSSIIDWQELKVYEISIYLE